MKNFFFLIILPALTKLTIACATQSSTPDNNIQTEEIFVEEEITGTEEDETTQEFDESEEVSIMEPELEIDIPPDPVLDEIENEETVTCTPIEVLRSTGDGPVSLNICPALVTYVSYLGYFIQSDPEGPAIMVFEGTSWTPDVEVGDEITMRVTSLTTFEGTKEINGHGTVNVLSSGNDVDSLIQDLSSGIEPSENLESEIVRIEGAIVNRIDGREVTVSYGSASNVLMIPDDSGILCEGGSFDIVAVVIENSTYGRHILKSYSNDDFKFIYATPCLHGGREPNSGDIIINEFMFDPPDGNQGDANCDGRRDPNEDEFIEIVNISQDTISLGGVQILDSVAVRHTFSPGTTIEPGKAIVVFGGGHPSCTLWPSDILVLKSSRGGLFLDLGGDSITVRFLSSAISSTSYSSSAPFDQSLTLSPDLDDKDPDPVVVGGFVEHWVADTIDHSLFSPGTKIDGSPF